MTEIKYYDFKQAKESELRVMVESLRHLLPSWLRVVSVYDRQSYYDGDSGTAATVDVDLSYLQASLNIYIPFWEEDSGELRLRYLRHEFCHIIVAKLANCASDMLSSFYPNANDRGPAHRFMKAKLDEAEEAAVQEMSFLLADCQPQDAPTLENIEE